MKMCLIGCRIELTCLEDAGTSISLCHITLDNSSHSKYRRSITQCAHVVNQCQGWQWQSLLMRDYWHSELLNQWEIDLHDLLRICGTGARNTKSDCYATEKWIWKGFVWNPKRICHTLCEICIVGNVRGGEGDKKKWELQIYVKSNTLQWIV